MREINKIAETIFEKIRSRFENVSLGDEKANTTSSPEDARFYNFNYVSKEGKNFGNVHISIVDPDSLKIYYARNITDELDDNEQQDWFEWLRSMRLFARRNMMSFDTRDISRSNLKVSDDKQQSRSDGTYAAKEISVAESVVNESMYGSRLNSYEDRGPVTIRVKHSDYIDPDKRGARARKIESIFLETHRGERFLLDYNNLHYARAQARHVSEGGSLHDDLGQHISGIMKEMASMKHFIHGAGRRQFEDTETGQMVESAIKHYESQKQLLRKLRKSREYKDYKESYVPENPIEDDIDVDQLRERFVKKIYNDKFDDALPYVYRAHQREQMALETNMAEEFERWVSEEQWNVPDSDAETLDLDQIMATPLEVGQDGLNAQGALEGIVGDDELFDNFKNLSDAEGAEADARPTILNWLKSNMPELFAKYNTNAQRPVSPEQPEQPNQTTGASGMDEPVTQPSPAGSSNQEQDDMNTLKQLAGLK
jgi:hypothetical protein